MTISKTLVPLALAAALAGGTAAVAASPRDTLVRHHISYGGVSAGVRSGTSVTFATPATWTALPRRDVRHLSFRVAHTACSYSVTFTTVQAASTTETPAEHVAAALPAAGANRLLDAGTRGSTAAWRVTHPASGDGRVHLTALRADRRSLGKGARVWQETTASAVSRAGSECHTGTYRDALGPQIGDALATAVGRAYAFPARR